MRMSPDLKLPSALILSGLCPKGNAAVKGEFAIVERNRMVLWDASWTGQIELLLTTLLSAPCQAGHFPSQGLSDESVRTEWF